MSDFIENDELRRDSLLKSENDEEGEEDDRVGILSANTPGMRDLSMYDKKYSESSGEEDNDDNNIAVGDEYQNMDNDHDEVGTTEYEQLQDTEEFGDFQGFGDEKDENEAFHRIIDGTDREIPRFANFYGSHCQKDLSKSPFPLDKSRIGDKQLSENLAIPQYLSIPPLSQGKL